MSVTKRFEQFLSNIGLTESQIRAGGERREAVVRVLNEKYYSTSSSRDNSLFVGSWAKHTRIRPPRDVDVLFTLPSSVYERFQGRLGNRQSQLLQEIRTYLMLSFPKTDIRGDGPTVIVPFSEYNVELIPAFKLREGGYWVCMTNSGGSYRKADYEAEIKLVSGSDENSSGNTRHLIRMMKCWQGYCDVPIKSFWIEIMAIEFVSAWPSKGKSHLYYDWMIRDFLEYIVSKTNSFIYAPGTLEPMYVGEAWGSKAASALGRAKKACEYEAASKTAEAGEEWQKIFGNYIPKAPA